MKRQHERDDAASVSDAPDGRPALDMTPTGIGRGCVKLAVVLFVISFVGFIILMIYEALVGG